MKPVLQQAIIAALENIGPMTMNELATHTGRANHVVYEAVTRLRTKGMVYIADYPLREDGKGGRRAPRYALGFKDDAPEPPQMSHRERNARYRERHRVEINTRLRVRRHSSPLASPWDALLKRKQP